MGILQKLRFWSRVPEPPKPQKPLVVVADGEFSVLDEDRIRFSLPWSDIREVVAFKHDNFSYDEIIVGFKTENDCGYFEVSEEFTGYASLLDELPRRLPGIKTEWFVEVAIPAFATNLTILWQHPEHLDAPGVA
jgi:hypothetical protein